MDKNAEMVVPFGEVVRARLIADGWLRFRGMDGADRFRKRMGPYVVVMLRLDEQGRYLERVDGWEKVEKDVDLREFDEAAVAIAAVLEA